MNQITAAFIIGIVAVICLFSGYFVGIQQHKTTVQQNVIAREPLCPNHADVGIQWGGEENSEQETIDFMRACGWIEATP